MALKPIERNKTVDTLFRQNVEVVGDDKRDHPKSGAVGLAISVIAPGTGGDKKKRKEAREGTNAWGAIRT